MLKFSPKVSMLIVDDDPSIVRLLEHIMNIACGDRISVRTFTTSPDAIDWIDQNLVDIVLTDFEMPGIDGIELLRLVKRKNPCSQVIFITGQSTLSTIISAMECGATDYLLKPIDRAEVVELVYNAERRVRRWRDAFVETAVPMQARKIASSSK